jgi:hypothetical protein
MGLPRNRRPGPKPDPDRDSEALDLKRSGLNYRQIAERLDCSPSTAYEAVQRALASVRQEPADALRRLEAERLDRLTAILEKVITRRLGIVDALSHFPPDEEDDAGEASDELLLKTVDRYLRVQERRAKLFGLDAPARHEITLDTIESEIERLERDLGDETP